jgi:hypothetical protein
MSKEYGNTRDRPRGRLPSVAGIEKRDNKTMAPTWRVPVEIVVRGVVATTDLEMPLECRHDDPGVRVAYRVALQQVRYSR